MSIAPEGVSEGVMFQNHYKLLSIHRDQAQERSIIYRESIEP